MYACPKQVPIECIPSDLHKNIILNSSTGAVILMKSFELPLLPFSLDPKLREVKIDDLFQMAEYLLSEILSRSLPHQYKE